MTGAELFLRTQDIERPEPGADVLDRLEANGHARNGFCAKCWSDAGNQPLAYLERLDEQEVTAACQG